MATVNRIWYSALDADKGSVLSADGAAISFVDSLRRAGLKLEELDGLSPAAGPGIFFFKGISEPVCDRLRTYSRNSFERVLAVAVDRPRVPTAEVWRLLQAGASDVIVLDEMRGPEAIVQERLDRWSSIDRLVQSSLVQNNLVGQSRGWVSVLRQVVEVACFSEVSVLIMGESGTGKELVARLIHTLDPRPDKGQLIVLDCTTVVPELSGSEFFGHEKGAFTGASAARDGAFALADGGTLFLDEVGELPPGLQAELLRVVQERTFKRVGSNTWRKTNFRLICATNRDLPSEVNGGRFRRDLYYRMASSVVKLPSLREHREDIPLLARHFLCQANPEREPCELDAVVSDYLLTRDYPGNVRELQQLVRRMAFRHAGHGPITAGNIPEDERPALACVEQDWRTGGFELAIQRALALGIGLREISREAAKTALHVAMDATDGNVKQAARLLGVTDRALHLRRSHVKATTLIREAV
jgi:transcriptional regulator with GAF, ATPase, and Fis domain